MKLVSSLFLLAAAGVAHAADISCAGCSAAQFSNKALTAGYGQHRIYDLDAGTLRAYSVTCSNEVIDSKGELIDGVESRTLSVPGACPGNGVLLVQETGIDTPTLKAFKAVREFYVANGNSLGAIRVDLRNESPPSGAAAGSVYGFLTDAAARGMLYDWLRTDYSRSNILEQLSVALSHSLMAALGILPENAFVVEITFQDGSKVSVKYKAEDSTFQILPDSARDPNGIPIPQSNQLQNQGQYNFDNAYDRDQFIRYLISMGIPVSSGTGNRVTCTWDAVNTTLRCVPN